MVDVTDDTFEEAVLKRSFEVPVVVDLWAPWCGPCKTLGPILEQVIGATDGTVELAKVNVDENPTVSSSFKVQSIPAVFAVRDGAVVDQFIGAQPEAEIRAFIERLVPVRSEADLLAAVGADAGAEEPLRRALQLEPDHPVAVPALAALLIARGDSEEATSLLGRLPETPETRRLLAEARLAQRHGCSRRPPGIPRSDRDSRSGRPPDSRVPQGSLVAPVLTVPAVSHVIALR
jgi:putative thioredoxin